MSRNSHFASHANQFVFHCDFPKCTAVETISGHMVTAPMADKEIAALGWIKEEERGADFCPQCKGKLMTEQKLAAPQNEGQYFDMVNRVLVALVRRYGHTIVNDIRGLVFEVGELTVGGSVALSVRNDGKRLVILDPGLIESQEHADRIGALLKDMPDHLVDTIQERLYSLVTHDTHKEEFLIPEDKRAIAAEVRAQMREDMQDAALRVGGKLLPHGFSLDEVMTLTLQEMLLVAGVSAAMCAYDHLGRPPNKEKWLSVCEMIFHKAVAIADQDRVSRAT